MDGFHASPEELLRRAGAREERSVPTPPPPERGKAFGRLRVLTVADALAAPARCYLLRGLIAPGELSLWWGAPKCGKSFLLLRLAYALALGLGMWGRGARRCRVLYVAAEGEGGFAARLIALRDALGDAGDAFRYIAQRATVGPPASDLGDVIEAAQDMRADLIVLDTLARTFGDGDENGAKDMGGFVASLDRLREETGAHVAVIHHGRKDGSDTRGSSALAGAADLIAKVTKGQDGGPGAATVEAAKDDVDGDALGFRLRPVELPALRGGEARRTCVAEEADADARRSKPLPPRARGAGLPVQRHRRGRFAPAHGRWLAEHSLVWRAGNPLAAGVRNLPAVHGRGFGGPRPRVPGRRASPP
jgi:hypothetical protein